jgi:hypothetical protein
MKLITLKNPETLRGQSFSLMSVDVVDGDIKCLQLVANGDPDEDVDDCPNFVKVECNYASLKLLVPAPPKKEQRHVLRGTVLGLPIEENFEYASDAERRRREFITKVSEDDIALTVTVEEVVVAE